MHQNIVHRKKKHNPICVVRLLEMRSNWPMPGSVTTVYPFCALLNTHFCYLQTYSMHHPKWVFHSAQKGYTVVTKTSTAKFCLIPKNFSTEIVFYYFLCVEMRWIRIRIFGFMVL